MEMSSDQKHFQTVKESNQFSIEKNKCHSCLKYKSAINNIKIRAASYRRRLKLFSKFEMKLKGRVLGDDAINFCLVQLKKRNVKSKGRKYTREDKILALAFYKQFGRAYTKLRLFFALPTRQTIVKQSTN
jgi:hypothetical protein